MYGRKGVQRGRRWNGGREVEVGLMLREEGNLKDEGEWWEEGKQTLPMKIHPYAIHHFKKTLTFETNMLFRITYSSEPTILCFLSLFLDLNVEAWR